MAESAPPTMLSSDAGAFVDPQLLKQYAKGYRAELEPNSGRSILFLSWGADGKCSARVDSDPDQAARTERQESYFAAHRQQAADDGDPVAVAFVAEAREIWTRHDSDELVMFIISFKGATQVRLVEKPWVAAPHEHCKCGVRVGSSPEHDEGHREIDATDRAYELLEERLLADGADAAAAALDHARQVSVHVYGAINSDEVLVVSHEDRMAVYLASCLCVADGLTDVEGCPDPARLLGAAEKVALALVGEGLLADEALPKVLAAVARARLPPSGPKTFEAEDFPRNGVWLESLGLAGIVRYGQHYKKNNLRLIVPSTPRPVTEREVYRLAARRGKFTGKSVSLVDHFYDVLLQRQKELSRHPNPHFSATATERGPATAKFCILTREDAVAAKIQNLAE